MVTNSGIVKIIDFGFGKQTFSKEDFGKSITLNWWCEPPSEFKQAVYDYRTEVYFVGKLFQKIIVNGSIESFKYIKELEVAVSQLSANELMQFSEWFEEFVADQ